MTTTDLLLKAWINQVNYLRNTLNKANDTNLALRINPSMKTAGYWVRHLGEANYYFLKVIFGKEIKFDNLTIRTPHPESDNRLFDEELVKEFWETSNTEIETAIKAQTNEAWIEMVKMPFGECQRIDAVLYAINHNIHHGGQVAQTLKYGH